MTFNMTQHGDEWLDRALMQKPVIPDDGFSARLALRLQNYEKRRRIIFALAICAAFLVSVWVIPWNSIFGWVLNSGTMIETFMSTMDIAEAQSAFSQARHMLSSLITLAGLSIAGFAAWIFTQE